MSERPEHGIHTGIVLSVALVTFVSGFMLGIFSIRGYLISPALTEERRKYLHDPVESDQDDVDEDETLLDHAPNWANGVDADRRQGLRQRTGDGIKGPAASLTPAGIPGEECKLVLVVRTDLGMTKGKIAAQCSHATLACYKALSRHPAGTPEASILARWETLGQAKIAVQAKGEDEVRDLRRRARALGLTAEVIHDAGRTQIEAGSLTVLGVGPAPKSLVDEVTGKLKLL